MRSPDPQLANSQFTGSEADHTRVESFRAQLAPRQFATDQVLVQDSRENTSALERLRAADLNRDLDAGQVTEPASQEDS